MIKIITGQGVRSSRVAIPINKNTIILPSAATPHSGRCWLFSVFADGGLADALPLPSSAKSELVAFYETAAVSEGIRVARVTAVAPVGGNRTIRGSADIPDEWVTPPNGVFASQPCHDIVPCRMLSYPDQVWVDIAINRSGKIACLPTGLLNGKINPAGRPVFDGAGKFIGYFDYNRNVTLACYFFERWDVAYGGVDIGVTIQDSGGAIKTSADHTDQVARSIKLGRANGATKTEQALNLDAKLPACNAYEIGSALLRSLHLAGYEIRRIQQKDTKD
jgi:hypothetical protein